jgi:hypothetical protein
LGRRKNGCWLIGRETASERRTVRSASWKHDHHRPFHLRASFVVRGFAVLLCFITRRPTKTASEERGEFLSCLLSATSGTVLSTAPSRIDQPGPPPVTTRSQQNEREQQQQPHRPATTSMRPSMRRVGPVTRQRSALLVVGVHLTAMVLLAADKRRHQRQQTVRSGFWLPLLLRFWMPPLCCCCCCCHSLLFIFVAFDWSPLGRCLLTVTVLACRNSNHN